MPTPVTPFVGCDVFVTDESSRVLLVRRQDDGLWALPGGCQDLGETVAECACRECREETGFVVSLVGLLGVFSSRRYERIHSPWKKNEYCHLLFQATIVGGVGTPSTETSEVAFFAEQDLPALSDGHAVRISWGFRVLRESALPPFFE